MKKVLAMVLATVMIVGLVQGIGPAKEAKAADTPDSLGYTRIGINDFGLEEERTWPGILEKEIGTYNGDLSGKYLDVNLQFSGEQSVNTSFDYAAGTNGWGGIRVGVFNDGLYIYPATMEGNQNTVNCVYFAPKTIGIRDFTQEFNLKLAVKYDSLSSGTANNVTIQAWANGVYGGYEYESVVLFGQTIGVHATAGTITMKTPSEVKTDYATISIGDFGLSEERTWPMTPAEEYGTYLYGDLKDTCFNANVKFEGAQDSSNAFDYASSDYGWGGLRVAVIAEEFYIYPATDGEAPLTSDYIKYTVDDANVGTFKQTFNLKLALTYDSIASKVGKNVKVTVWVNGAKKTHTFANVRMFGTMLGVHATDGNITMSNPSNPANTNVLVTPEDLGIAYGTYNASGTSIVRQDTKDTMDQLTISAKMKFEGTGAYVIMCSEDALGWSGLRFGTSEVNSKYLYLYDTKLGLNIEAGKGFAFDPSIAGATLVGKEVEV